MASVIQTNFRLRKNYGKADPIVAIPNLIGIQKRSYDAFLQVTPRSSRQGHAISGKCPGSCHWLAAAAQGHAIG